jgi:putative ABC transport system permease protein
VKLINGASKPILARELITESLILSFASILTGLLIAIKLSDILNITVFQSGRIADVCLIALFFIIVIVLISVFPLFTSRIVTDIKLLESPGRLYKLPLVLQYSLAIIAITGSIVLNRQMNFISSLHPESQNEDMMVISDNTWEAVQRYELFKSELLKNPDILDITAAMEKPGGEIIDNVAFEMEGIEKKEEQRINIFTIDSNFFTFLEIKPFAGSIETRFTPSHQWETEAIELSTLRQSENIDKNKLADLEKRVGNYREKYILNQSALKMLGITSPEEAIGKRFRLNFFLPDLFPEGEIAGIVPDFHYTDLHSEEKPLAIVPRKLFDYCFIIRINPLQRKKAISGIAATWEKINPEFPFQYEFINDVYQNVYAGEYTQTHVLSLFAIISVILSSLGIFALAAFSMERRIKEIGIRKVNGAKVSEILVMLNMDFLKWVLIAFLTATPVVYYIMQKWLQNFAYKTSLSWWIFVLAGMLAYGIALLTVSWQSWRAAKRNPVESLRYE